MADSTHLVKSGFTLLELSLVLIVLALMVAGIFSALSQDTRRAKQTDVQTKLNTIQAELLDFRRRNNRLPCPADGTLPITSQYYGVEAVNAGACTTGSTYDANGNRTVAAAPGPTANFSDGSFTVAGVVPIKTLGLSDEYMFDPWGGRFTYAVDIRATGNSPPAFTTYLANDTTIGSITVMDGSVYPAYPAGNARTTKAMLVVLSHGPDGHGAYQLSGVRKVTGATNSDELQNCHCDGTGATTAAQPFNATYVQHTPNTANSADPLNVFDDIVLFYLRSDMLSAAEASTGQ